MIKCDIKTWNHLGIKDKIQQVNACILMFSGVLLAFLSFFLNEYSISDSILIYIAQAFVTAGAIFGVSVYVNTKVGEAKKATMEYINNRIENLDKEESAA
jgi:hypothetical protein